MYKAVSYSPLKMALHLEYLQVGAPGTLNGLLAEQKNVGLTAVLGPLGLVKIRA